MNYSDQLKDPRWQKKRLKILERDEWRCVACGCKHTTLHVHHIEYSKLSWQVDDNKLYTLCNQCHTEIHNVKRCKEHWVHRQVKLTGLNEDELLILIIRCNHLKGISLHELILELNGRLD